MAYIALHFGNIQIDFHAHVGDSVDGNVRRVGQGGIGVCGGFIVETISCGGNCCHIEHCMRDNVANDNCDFTKGGCPYVPLRCFYSLWMASAEAVPL